MYAIEYFSTPALTGLLQQLRHLCLFGADVLVVEGAAGAGKTRLSHELQAELFNQQSEDDCLFECWAVDDGASFADVVSGLLAVLGLQSVEQTPGEGLRLLRSFAQSAVRESRLIVLLIDDAQRLDDDALGAVLSLLQGRQGSSYGLRFVFFSLPGIAARIDALSLLDLQIYDFQMPEFSQPELGRFLPHVNSDYSALLEQGGASFLAQLWRRSKGCPGVALAIAKVSVGDVADDESAESVSRPAVSSPLPLTHMFMLAGLVAVLIFVALYSSDGSDEAVSSRVATSLILPELQVSAAPVRKDSLLPFVSGDGVVQGAGDVASANAVGAQVALVATAEEVVVSAAVDVVESASVELVGQDAAQPVGQGAVDVDARDIEAPRASPGAQVTPKAEAGGSNLGQLTADEHALLQAADGAYVLQLLAASKKDNLQSFVDAQENRGVLKIYRRQREGQSPWYIVVAGPFASKQKAELALPALPKNQRDTGPWPKSVVAVKQEISVFHKK